MGKLIKTHLKVNKPKLTSQAMCIYKFTLDTGYFYYGATSDLGDRICCHFKEYRGGTHTKIIMEAMDNAKEITFEFVKFINNRADLHIWEERYLLKNIGLPKCLNREVKCVSSHIRSETLSKVAKVNKEGAIVEIYLSPTNAAVQNGVTASFVIRNCNSKYPRTETYFRRLCSDGIIINPENPSVTPMKCKAVRQFDKQMNFIAEFSSISDAARFLNFDRRGIGTILNGKTKSIGGFIFRQLDDNGNIIEPVYKGRKNKKIKRERVAGNVTPKKPILKLDLNGNVLESYRSVYMAVKNIPIEHKTLSKVIKRSTPFKGNLYKYA